MSITDELRKWWVRKFPVMDKELHKDFTAIADRIDAEHESACGEAYGNGVMSVPIAMDESAWVELPKDADGEYIHVGDVMEWVRYEGSDQTIVRKVSGVGDGVFFAWSDEQGRYAQYEAHAYRHHRAPTVEGVLTEMVAKVIERGELTNGAAQTIAEYAGKLRLAKEDA